MQSMTGFGASFAKCDDFQAEIHIKAVNSRYTDIKFFIPPRYRLLEPFFRAAVFQKIHRGACSVFIERLPKAAAAPVSLTWSAKEALKWKKISKALSQTLNIPQDLSLSHFIGLEGVVSVFQGPDKPNIKEEKLVKSSFKKALELLIRERAQEGRALQKDLALQYKKLKALAPVLQAFNDRQVQQSRGRVKSGAGGGGLLLEKEKYDFHEEALRFQAHLRHFSKMLESKGPVGKKLEFYAQELLRELNTICSKSLKAEGVHLAVRGKVLVEKIKEQAQNVE